MVGTSWGSALAGYSAGLPLPGFYQRWWDWHFGDEPGGGSAEWSNALIGGFAAHLRRNGNAPSFPVILAAIEQAQRLAWLRGRAMPLRDDVLDAVRSTFIKGEIGRGDSGVLGEMRTWLTGTAIGDPIEVSSLTTVFRESTDARGYCALGSVKSNVGHLRMAAGVVSFIKACLALERRTLPPTAHFGNPNPRIDFEQSPFFVNADAREWQGGAYPRRAGVSAFGFGGSNVHVVLEEHPEAESAPSTRHSHLLTVSAPSETTLKRELQDLGTHFEEHPELSVADVAHTLQCGRKAWPHRACVRVDSHEPSPGRLFDGPAIITGTAKTDNRPTVFLFPGMGSQRPGMGEGLYRSEEVYRNTVDHCAELLEPELGIDIRSLIHRKEGAAEPHSPEKNARE